MGLGPKVRHSWDMECHTETIMGSSHGAGLRARCNQLPVGVYVGIRFEGGACAKI
jgi:hypothetical protein